MSLSSKISTFFTDSEKNYTRDDEMVDLVEPSIETTETAPNTGIWISRGRWIFVLLAIGIGISLGAIFVLSMRLFNSVSTASPSSPSSSPPFTQNSRIAIIGAGVSGIHMAYILKNRGYNNVVLFEKELLPGGNAKSFQINGTWYELGVSVITDYYKRTKILVEQHSMSPSNLKMSFECEPRAEHNITGLSITEALQKLRDFYYHLTKNSSYIFPAQPPPDDILQILAMPFGQFLKDNDMESLFEAFSDTFKLYSYGSMKTTPTYYGYDIGTEFGIIGFKEGLGNLFLNLTTGMEIRFGIEIRSVIRQTDGKINIIYHEQNDTDLEEEKFDFLILACGLQNTPDWLDLRPEELEIFQYYNLNVTKWTTTLLSSNRWSSDRRTCLPSNPNFYGLLGFFPEKPNNRIVFQVTTGHSDEESMVLLNKSLSLWYNMTIEDTHIWSRNHLAYSPTFTPAGIINKIPWTVWDLQGKYNTWYVGASVTFDLLEVVIDYNHQLVDFWLGEE